MMTPRFSRPQAPRPPVEQATSVPCRERAAGADDGGRGRRCRPAPLMVPEDNVHFVGSVPRDEATRFCDEAAARHTRAEPFVARPVRAQRSPSVSPSRHEPLRSGISRLFGGRTTPLAALPPPSRESGLGAARSESGKRPLASPDNHGHSRHPSRTRDGGKRPQTPQQGVPQDGVLVGSPSTQALDWCERLTTKQA